MSKRGSRRSAVQERGIAALFVPAVAAIVLAAGLAGCGDPDGGGGGGGGGYFAHQEPSVGTAAGR